MISGEKIINMIDINKIFSYLPHRYPFLLVDRVIEYQLDQQKLLAIKNVTINEPFFNGHFPGKPIMPGVLILEALGQACIILAHHIHAEEKDNGIHYLTGIDNARFKQMVVPGDQLHLEVEIVRRKCDIWQMHGEATVNGNLACRADLMSAKKG